MQAQLFSETSAPAAQRRLLTFLQDLLARVGDEARFDSVRLAEAALRYHALPHASRPFQVAVIGPTQTGKSSIVNLLLHTDAARVSPLAGYTVHAQGFEVAGGGARSGPASSTPDWRDELFPGYARTPQTALSRDILEQYSLEPVDSPLPPSVTWDTPDYDSLSSRSYRRSLLEAAGLADLIIVVLSQEKYGDLSVWQFLRMLSPLQTPLMVVVNKLSQSAQDVIVPAVRDKLAQTSAHFASTPVFALPPVKTPAEMAAADIEPLRSAVRSSILQPAPLSNSGVVALIRENWGAWTDPLRCEHAAVEAWTAAVDGFIERALAMYRREFLEHPQRYDTFRQATAALLDLLELPAFARTVGQVRRVLTWPARRAWQALQPKNESASITGEERILRQIMDDLDTSLIRTAVSNSQSPGAARGWWRALSEALMAGQTARREQFQAAVDAHCAATREEVRQAANELYAALQQRPAALNTLRTARATADVASIALAVKTGGLHLHDLLFAPAMLAFTSMLTEGALKGYMHTMESSLKRRQVENMRTALRGPGFAGDLRALAARLAGPGVIGIPLEELQAAERALQEMANSP